MRGPANKRNGLLRYRTFIRISGAAASPGRWGPLSGPFARVASRTGALGCACCASVVVICRFFAYRGVRNRILRTVYAAIED